MGLVDLGLSDSRPMRGSLILNLALEMPIIRAVQVDVGLDVKARRQLPLSLVSGKRDCGLETDGPGRSKTDALGWFRCDRSLVPRT